jgi:uncharacterized protein YbaR (Trm112 family)
MPRWMLACPKCSHKFPHSEIGTEMIERSLRDPFRILPRPEFAPEGEKRSCPSCKTESVFRPFQLFYSEDKDLSDQL